MPELECLLTSSEMSDDDFVFCFSDTSCARVSLLDELNMQPTEPNSDDDKKRGTHPFRLEPHHPWFLRRFPDEAARA